MPSASWVRSSSRLTPRRGMQWHKAQTVERKRDDRCGLTRGERGECREANAHQAAGKVPCGRESISLAVDDDDLVVSGDCDIALVGRDRDVCDRVPERKLEPARGFGRVHGESL